MSLLDSFPRLALVGIAFYLSYALLRSVFTKSSLDILPGRNASWRIDGHMKSHFSRQCWTYREDGVRRYGALSTFSGLFWRKWVAVHDPKAVHSILVKDSHIYDEPVFSLNLILGPGLLGTEGDQHKRQRKMLNPVFSTKHLRVMMPAFYSVIHRARDALSARVRSPNTDASVELDMLNWMGRLTLEIMGQAGFGYSFDPLTEDFSDEFATAVKDLFPMMQETVHLRPLLPLVLHIGTRGFRRRAVELIPSRSVQRLIEISDILHQRSVLIFHEKKTSLEKGDETLREGNDVMSVMLRSNMQASEQDRLPNAELIAQISTFVLAGMDTTANSLSKTFELLADHPDVQEKLRSEIFDAVQTRGHADMLDFDALLELPYLDAVCRETLRMFPGVATIFRVPNRDIMLPLSTPITLRDGSLASDVLIPKGSRVALDIVAFNRSPELWGPDAHVWRPERWLEPLPSAVEDARISGVYSPLMTFSAGNRACIGFKVAQVEMKSVIFILLQNFKFEPSGKPIMWNFAAVQYPTVGKEGVRPELPLKLSLLRR